MEKKIKRYLPTVILILILSLAAYLRLFKISEYLTFLGDEGRDVLVVKRMIVDHKFTLLGPTASVGGFFLGPIYYYFMIPFLWAWQLDPVGPAVMVGLFGIVTVWLVYVTGASLFGKKAGLIAASLYAVSPLVIAYSRSSWNPNIVPFFSVLLIYFLWRLVWDKRLTLLSLSVGIILGIGIQLHYLFLFLFVTVGIWYILHVRVLPIRKIATYTILGFLIGASPFIAFEVRHGFANTRTISQFIFTGKDTGFIFSSYVSIIAEVWFRLFSRLVFRIPPAELWNSYPDWYITTLLVLSRTAQWVTGVLLGILLFRTVHSARSKKAVLIIAIWLFTVLLLFGLYRKSIYDYYLGIVFPIPFLLVGLTLSSLWKKTSGKILSIALWAGLLFFNWQGRPFIYPPNNQLEQVKTIARTAFSQTEGKPFNFALMTDGNSDHAYRYFFEIWGNPPVVIENTDMDPGRFSVTNQLIVICETINCQPLGASLWEIAGFGRAEIAGIRDAPFVKIYKLVHFSGNE